MNYLKSDNMNKKIVDLINEILDYPSDTIPNDLLRDLTDRLSDCEMYVPVEDDEIVLYNWGPYTFIPVSCDLSDFRQVFKDESPVLFKFTRLEDFLTRNISGFMINPGGRSFILNKYLSQMAFNRHRAKDTVSGGYDVKVRLNDFRPLTWRDLIIPDNITFMELDDIHREAGQIRAIKDIEVSQIGFISASGFAQKEDGYLYYTGDDLYAD